MNPQHAELGQEASTTGNLRDQLDCFSKSDSVENPFVISQENDLARARSGLEISQSPAQSEMVVGKIADAQWPKASIRTGAGNFSTGEDWLLIRLSDAIGINGGVACNRFYVPGSKTPQMVVGYHEAEELISGSVWVCGGVSGIQEGHLNSNLASVVLAGVIFHTFSISLQRPLRRFKSPPSGMNLSY